MSASIERIDLSAGSDLRPVEQLLTSGGDKRIVCDPIHGLNKYGCPSAPQPDVLAFGSSTASTITPAGFAAAERLRERLRRAARVESPSVTYARELDRVRARLLDLCGLSDFSGAEVVFGASGTDLHLIAAQLAGGLERPPLLAIVIEAAETGSGVPAALGGRHFSNCSALGGDVAEGLAIFGGAAVEVVSISGRTANGAPRPAALIDAEVEAHVVGAVGAGRRVLLNLVDVSKTGLIAPSPNCALGLRRRFPDAVDILVDGCQFRLAPSTLRCYLAHGFWIALTGSKFVGGPAFSGALLLPERAARRLRTRFLPPAFRAYSARAEWPAGWLARLPLGESENYGLLLRWQAALHELQSFHALPAQEVSRFLLVFAERVRQRLTSDPTFQPLPVPAIDRAPLGDGDSWDQVQTIFPFILRRPLSAGRPGAPLTRAETARVYQLLGSAGDRQSSSSAVVMRRCQLGQPVACGTVDGVPVSALRLCLSARLIVDAVSPQGRGPQPVIDEAFLALDKAALLAGALDD